MKLYDPLSKKVFVFGSNRRGIHGCGAALYARQHLGALQLVGEGPMPDPTRPSCYALPTKMTPDVRLPLDEIRTHVQRFCLFAEGRPDLEFFVTRVGCKHAGYTDSDIASLFEGAPINCELPEGWRR